MAMEQNSVDEHYSFFFFFSWGDSLSCSFAFKIGVENKAFRNF